MHEATPHWYGSLRWKIASQNGGSAAYTIQYVADDFDAPLEDFDEYKK